MGKQDLTIQAVTFVFQASAITFFGGMMLSVGAMVLAQIMPLWWQHVFMFLAVPTIISLPLCFITGIAAVLATRTTGDDNDR